VDAKEDVQASASIQAEPIAICRGPATYRRQGRFVNVRFPTRLGRSVSYFLDLETRLAHPSRVALLLNQRHMAGQAPSLRRLKFDYMINERA
jgi:hypothetical protein